MLGILKVVGIIAGVIAAVIFLLSMTVIDFWTVPVEDEALTASMAPTLGAGDFVMLAKDDIPEVPNLVRCTDPDYADRFVVARVIAKNTEPVTIVRDIANSKGRRELSSRQCDTPSVEVTGKFNTKRTLSCREENYAGSSFQILVSGEEPSEDVATAAEPGKLYLVSDNRTMHVDSRDYGQIEPRMCRRIYMRLWGPAGIVEPHFTWMF